MPRIVLPRTNSKRMVLLLLVVILLSALDSHLDANARNPAPAVSRIAPNFSRMDLDHRQVNLADYRGKVILLNFWATWCAPCLAEMPRFVEWQQEYGGRGLQVIGISMDDEEQPVRAVYQKYRLNYPVVMGDEKIGKLYGGIFGLPVIFLIDAKGKIRFKHQESTDLVTIESEIRNLLSMP